jgi:fumarylacetoacetase
MRPGDLLGSGTISGNEKNSYGSMMELTWYEYENNQ